MTTTSEQGQMKFVSGKYLFFLTRLVLGAIFIAASIDKIIHPGQFAKIIYNYQLLPEYLINIVAIVLPWLEVFLGLLIIAEFWLPGAAVLANLLLFSFFSALIYNLSRGMDVHCGCFSTEVTGAPYTSWYLIRDSLFLLLGISLLILVFRGRKNRRSILA
ncbi:MAG: MauE/DoxX family redox-associated membrane protein [Syntrophobacteraceae bacterium]